MFPFPALVFFNRHEHAQPQSAFRNLDTFLLAFRICASSAVGRSYLYKYLSPRSREDLLQVRIE